MAEIWGHQEPQGPGWWQASDGRWYPPESAQTPTADPAPTPAPATGPAGGSPGGETWTVPGAEVRPPWLPPSAEAVRPGPLPPFTPPRAPVWTEDLVRPPQQAAPGDAATLPPPPDEHDGGSGVLKVLAITGGAVMAVIVLGVAAVSLLGTSTAEPGHEDAVIELQLALGEADYPLLYERMHPAHQEIITREHFMECVRAIRPEPVVVEAIDITESYGELMQDPAIAGHDAYAVVVNTAYSDAEGDIHTWDAQMHVVDVDGEWLWLANLQSFSNGGCPNRFTLDDGSYQAAQNAEMAEEQEG